MMKAGSAIVATGLALLAGGCISVDNDSGGDWHRHHCSDGRNVEIRYDNPRAAEPRAQMVIAGRRIDLIARPSASGARYATANGLRGGYGLVWWTQNGVATLAEFALGGGKPETAIATCAPVRR